MSLIGYTPSLMNRQDQAPPQAPRAERFARAWWRFMLVASAAALACSKEAQPPAGPRVMEPAPNSDAGSADSGGAAIAPVCGSSEAGQGEAVGSGFNRGPALMIGEHDGFRVPVWDGAGDTGINGLAYLIQSRLGGDGPVTTPAALSAPSGKLCIAGNTVIVPLMSFADYWGAEINLFLNRPVSSGAPAGDAGMPGQPPILPWDPADANVIGFSFVVEGNDTALPCDGLPPAIRVESSPFGGNLDQDIYCRELRGLVSGETRDVLFSDIVHECWEPGGPGILSEPRPAGYTGELQNLEWLVPADVMASHAFDLCISDIRPILGR